METMPIITVQKKIIFGKKFNSLKLMPPINTLVHKLSNGLPYKAKAIEFASYYKLNILINLKMANKDKKISTSLQQRKEFFQKGS